MRTFGGAGGKAPAKFFEIMYLTEAFLDLQFLKIFANW